MTQLDRLEALAEKDQLRDFIDLGEADWKLMITALLDLIRVAWAAKEVLDFGWQGSEPAVDSLDNLQKHLNPLFAEVES